jgi:hypothetical protein
VECTFENVIVCPTASRWSVSVQVTVATPFVVVKGLLTTPSEWYGVMSVRVPLMVA